MINPIYVPAPGFGGPGQPGGSGGGSTCPGGGTGGGNGGSGGPCTVGIVTGGPTPTNPYPVPQSTMGVSSGINPMLPPICTNIPVL